MQMQKNSLLMSLCVSISLISGCATRPTYCPKLPVPPPLSSNIRIVINDQRIVTNQGGEALIRDYIAMRLMIIALCRN